MIERAPNILIFDSGIGGISIYNEVRKLIPYAHYLYFFDNKFFPYGDKSNEFIIDRVNFIIDRIVKKYSTDLAIIACNTASTICLPNLRANFDFPFVGVVPAIKPAVEVTRNNCIGLLATQATVQGEYTKTLIRKYAKNCHVELLGLSELAIMAEDKLQGKQVDLNMLRNLLQPWLKLPIQPDTIVLGCTHYPFLKEELSIIFPDVSFIDSGYAIAARTEDLLKESFSLSKIDDFLEHNFLSSSSFHSTVKNTIKHVQKYNLPKYQLIDI